VSALFARKGEPMEGAKGTPAATMAPAGGVDLKRAVEDALRDWRGSAAGVAVGAARAADAARLPTRLPETCLMIRGWTGGAECAGGTFVCGEAEARAALGVEPDAPLLPFAQGFLERLEERIIAALPPDSQVLFEIEEAVRMTRGVIEAAGLAGASREFDVTLTVGEGGRFAGHFLAGTSPSGGSAGAGGARPGAVAMPDSLNVILDVELPLVVRLGEAEMLLEDLLRLRPGSVIELNKQVNEPAEILVNDKVVAYGEVVVLQENFGVRISRLAHPASENIRLVR
jgi:flagellar motor switch protein FliN